MSVLSFFHSRISVSRGIVVNFAPMNSNQSNTWRWIRRYVKLPFLLTVGIIAALYLFNDHSALTYYEYETRINDLRTQIKATTDTLEYYRRLNRSLDTDPEAMERIVRERHHMQRADEDVYIME